MPTQNTEILKRLIMLIGFVIVSRNKFSAHYAKPSNQESNPSAKKRELFTNHAVKASLKRRQGKFKNSLAICGMSKSMRGTFMEEIAVTMGLFISELSDYPWKGKIRKIGIAEKFKKENMVKNIFVFTDSDFEGAFMDEWVLDYKEAWKSYRPKWYNSVPQIVFWNLKGPIGCPMEIGTEKDHRGLLMLHGWVFKKFDEFVLEGRWGCNIIGECEYDEFCYDVMKSAISGEEFKNLVIFD
ncbi:hypothetical protein SO802_028797 [Lithocarpus litseifolius]|uniref:DUF7788 domain-containing protein n=1 Tax=Lithocarpus litseifolius TaxID=425828 RepID=A0AAW2BSU9_9ROSI